MPGKKRSTTSQIGCLFSNLRALGLAYNEVFNRQDSLSHYMESFDTLLHTNENRISEVSIKHAESIHALWIEVHKLNNTLDSLIQIFNEVRENHNLY